MTNRQDDGTTLADLIHRRSRFAIRIECGASAFRRGRRAPIGPVARGGRPKGLCDIVARRRRLPLPHARSALRMAQGDGLTARDLARLLGVAESAVRLAVEGLASQPD